MKMLVTGENGSGQAVALKLDGQQQLLVTPSKLAGESIGLDRILTTRKLSWMRLTDTALVFGSADVVTPGIYHGIFIEAEGTAGTVAVYDADDTATTTTPLPAPVTLAANLLVRFDAAVTTGLAVILGGSVKPIVWVAYEVGA